MSTMIAAPAPPDAAAPVTVMSGLGGGSSAGATRSCAFAALGRGGLSVREGSSRRRLRQAHCRAERPRWKGPSRGGPPQRARSGSRRCCRPRRAPACCCSELDRPAPAAAAPRPAVQRSAVAPNVTDSRRRRPVGGSGGRLPGVGLCGTLRRPRKHGGGDLWLSACRRTIRCQRKRRIDGSHRFDGPFGRGGDGHTSGVHGRHDLCDGGRRRRNCGRSDVRRRQSRQRRRRDGRHRHPDNGRRRKRPRWRRGARHGRYGDADRHGRCGRGHGTRHSRCGAATGLGTAGAGAATGLGTAGAGAAAGLATAAGGGGTGRLGAALGGAGAGTGAAGNGGTAAAALSSPTPLVR